MKKKKSVLEKKLYKVDGTTILAAKRDGKYYPIVVSSHKSI